MVTTGEYKWVSRAGNGPQELFDLSEDPAETKNLADDAGYRPIRAEMDDRMKEWFATYSDAPRDGWFLPVSGKGQLGLNSFKPL